MEEPNQLNFHLLGSKEEYDRVFDEIISLPTNTNPKKIISVIQKKLSLLTPVFQQLENKLIEKFTFYRIRVEDENNPIGEFESSTESFSYPPDTSSIKLNRANLKNEQVFYASGDANTPFYELSKDIIPGKSVVYLSKWGINAIPSNIFMRSLFLGLDMNQEENHASIVGQGVIKKYQEISQTMPSHLRELYLYCQLRYTELFTYPGKNMYHISSAIAHESFNNISSADFDSPIVMYPSIEKDFRSVNFAIRKDFVDKYLYLKEVDKVNVTELNQGNVSITPIKRGIPKENGITWYYPESKIQACNKMYISYDSLEPNTKFTVVDDTIEVTSCCDKHSVSIYEFINNNGFELDKVISSIQLPHMKYFDFELECKSEFIAFVEITGSLYLVSELDKKRQMRFIGITVTHEFKFVKH